MDFGTFLCAAFRNFCGRYFLDFEDDFNLKFENIISDDGHRMMTDRNIY